MIRRLLRRRRTDAGGGAAAGADFSPAEQRYAAPCCETPVYAVGDIHGRDDLLARLLDAIMADAAARGHALQLVFLGDYVDRGADSRAVLERLIGISADAGIEAVFLRGNHEQMLLDFLHEPTTGLRWLQFGGLETLLSYGVGIERPPRSPEEAAALAARLEEALGAHRRFIESLPLSWRLRDLFFAHAGIDPLLPVEEQEPAVLLWGSPRLLRMPVQDCWVVHGHFIVERPLVAAGRVAIDTGAYASGRLTAAAIGPDGIRFLQT